MWFFYQNKLRLRLLRTLFKNRLFFSKRLFFRARLFYRTNLDRYQYRLCFFRRMLLERDFDLNRYFFRYIEHFLCFY